MTYLFLILLLFISPVVAWFSLVLSPLLFSFIFFATPFAFLLCKGYQRTHLIVDDDSLVIGEQGLAVVMSRGPYDFVNQLDYLVCADERVEAGVKVSELSSRHMLRLSGKVA